MKHGKIYKGSVGRLAIQCTCPDSGETGDFLFVGESHKNTGSRVTPVYPSLIEFLTAEVLTGKWQQVPGDATTYLYWQ